MSGIVNAIGKVFSPISMLLPKKIGNVVRKVAVGALMVGAVVMTGGAALGLLPSMGAMVGGLGLSAGLTSVLSGAISTGAVGALGGFLKSGSLKGAATGFAMGAATGGIMGATGMLGANGLIGGGKAIAGSSGLLPSSGALAQAPALGLAGSAPSIAGVSLSGAGATASSLLPSIGGAAAAAAPAAVAGAAGALPSIAGLGGGLAQNPMLMSSLLSGVSQAFAPDEYKQRFNAQQEAEQRAAILAYGGGDVNGKKKGGMIQGVYSGQPNPFGTPNYGPPPTGFAASSTYQPRPTRWAWNPATNSVEERPA
jgi:hypothetical protein